MVREEKKTSKFLYFVSDDPRKAAQYILQNRKYRVSDIRSVKSGSSDIVSRRSKVNYLILRAFVSPSVHSFFILEKIILSFHSLIEHYMGGLPVVVSKLLAWREGCCAKKRKWQDLLAVRNVDEKLTKHDVKKNILHVFITILRNILTFQDIF